MTLSRHFFPIAICLLLFPRPALPQTTVSDNGPDSAPKGETSRPGDSADSGPRLSPEGQARMEAHRYLFGPYLKDRASRFLGGETEDGGKGSILDEVVILDEPQSVSGDVLIELPAGTQRVASMFRYLVFRGEGLDQLEGLEMLPYAANANLSISTQTPELYRVKVAAMPIPDAEMPAIRIRTRCKPGKTAVIREIALNSQGKLPVKFDDIPYRNLGEEFPRQSVRIDVDVSQELSLSGHIELEREKFCRYYAGPGTVHPSFENWANERNFAPGRQILKLQPALVVGYSPNSPKLTESASRPGSADLSFFDAYQGGSQFSRTIKPFRDIKYAMCFNDYPEFMSVHGVGRGTPLVEHFQDAADLAAAYVANEIKDAGRSATYWEVKNESTIKSEWDYHYRKDVDSWALLAELHNRVADAIHDRAPATMVGGPTSAWMQLQAANFGLYRNQAKFMDLTADHVDFYSHHFYEDIGSLGAWERRSGKYTNYLLGRLEAILNMLQSHMHATDNVKPILITECGSLQPGRGPSDYWLRLRSYSAYIHKFMMRPDEIDLAVPFAFMSIPWNPQSGDAAFIPREGKHNHSPLSDCDPTPMVHLFNLWRDFDGRRLPVHHDQRWLDVTAVHRNDAIQLAVTNMGGRRVSLDLTGWTSALPVESIRQRRLYYRDGEIVYEDATERDHAGEIPVDVEETTILTLQLKQPLVIDGTLGRQRWYASGTAINSAELKGRTFTLQVDNPDNLKHARLMVGVHREGGLGGPLRLTLNGNNAVNAAEWASEFNHLFAPIEFEIPVDWIGKRNDITLEGRDGLTITSVHLVTDHAVIP